MKQLASLLVGCCVTVVAVLGIWFAATNSHPSKKTTAVFSPFNIVSEAEFKTEVDGEGFADCIGIDGRPARANVVDVEARLITKEDERPFKWTVSAKPDPFTATVDDSAGWVGPPIVRAFGDGVSLGMIFDGCGGGLVQKYDQGGRLLQSFKIEGHVHAVGCLAPKKRLLCIASVGPIPAEPSRSQIHLFDWDSGREVSILTLPSSMGSIRRMAVSLDERFLFVSIPSRDKIYRLTLP